MESIDVTSQTFTGFFGGGCSVLANGRDQLEVIAGARVWYVSTKVPLQGGLLDGTNRRDSATWLNAVAGVRGKHFLSDRVYLTGWGMSASGRRSSIGVSRPPLAIRSRTVSRPSPDTAPWPLCPSRPKKSFPGK